jgi:hypothetical protein
LDSRAHYPAAGARRRDRRTKFLLARYLSGICPHAGNARARPTPRGLQAQLFGIQERKLMSVHKAIDQIVEAFIPEMEKISKMKESEEQKGRQYKAWLRATLQKFAADVRDIELSKTAEDSPGGAA